MTLEDCIAIVETALGALATDEKSLVAELYRLGDSPTVIIELVRARRWLQFKEQIEAQIERAMTAEEEARARRLFSEGMKLDAILTRVVPENSVGRSNEGASTPRSRM